MQIRRLRIDDHRCLVDFDIRFSTKEEGGSSTVLIGENGTGKSTMIQTVLEILTSFDSDAVAKKITYQYEFEYYYKGSIIKIQQSNRHYVIHIDGSVFCSGTLDTVKRKLEKAEKSIFPERISYFYSGQNNSPLYSIRRVESGYNRKCRGLLATYWNALYLQNRTYTGDFPKEKYNNCTEKLVPIYLLSILCGQDSYEKRFLKEQCRFSEIETVSILLNVDKISHRVQNDIVETGNEGVCDLISFLDDRFTDLFRGGFLYQDYDQFIYEIHNISEVDADTIAFFNFFEKLENLLDAEIEVTVKVGQSSVASKYLSEGQRQLIKVLGMLGVCKSEDGLVLMDEPDAHMNPKWKYDLKSIIDNCLAASEITNIQAIISTHDPLVINGVPKEFIRLFTHNEAVWQGNGFYITKVIEPTEETTGMGIDGLLQSQYYGLASTLDIETQELLEEKRNLLVKRKRDSLSHDEQLRLRYLSETLENMAFARNIPTDNYYDDFVAAVHEIYRDRPIISLSPEQIEERNSTLREIAKGLIDI